MEKFYITFGCEQALGAYYATVKAVSEEEAREVTFKQFGSCWCMIYSEHLGKELRFLDKLTEIELKNTTFL